MFTLGFPATNEANHVVLGFRPDRGLGVRTWGRHDAALSVPHVRTYQLRRLHHSLSEHDLELAAHRCTHGPKPAFIMRTSRLT